MTEVMTIVSARIALDRVDEVTEPFRRAVRDGMPERHRTTLLRGEQDLWCVVTTWHSRRELEAYLASVEEPFAWRLLRNAGGEPSVEVLDVVVDSGVPWWP